MKASNLTLRGAIKAASVSGAVLCAFLSLPAHASHISGPPPGPSFSQSGETCVLNRLGVGDCVIVGTVNDLFDPGYSPFYKVSWDTQYEGYADLAPLLPLVDSGTAPATGAGAVDSPAESLNSVTISGTSAVSVLGFGCTNASSAFDGSDPCYIDLAVGHGAVVANILQGELSYTFSTLNLAGTSTFVQTGTGQALIASQVSTASLASEQAYWAGATVVDGGPTTGGELWNVYTNTVGALGYSIASTSITGTYSVDPPLSEYLTPDVGGSFSGPNVDGSDGNQIGDSGVLNGVLFAGMSAPSSSVPEPTTLGLLGLGALAAAFGRKRRGIVGL
jgi:hypothetical protein